MNEDIKVMLLARLDVLRSEVESGEVTSIAYATDGPDTFCQGWANRNLSLVGCVGILFRKITDSDGAEDKAPRFKN